MPTPRRAVLGWDANRLAMLIAVLSTRYNLRLGDKEVYLNVVGGLRVEEPAADLAVAAALISAARNMPLPERSVWFGEIGLSGEVRPVNSMEARLREAEKLGFTSAYTPKINLSSTHAQNILHIHPIQHIRQMLPSRTSEPAFAD